MLDKETEIVRYKMQTGLINKKQDNCEDFNIFINPWIYYENFYANSYLELFFNFNP